MKYTRKLQIIIKIILFIIFLVVIPFSFGIYLFNLEEANKQLKELTCPEPEIQEIQEAEIITIVEEGETVYEERIVYQDVYKDKIIEKIVEIEVIKEVPAVCPACICQAYRDCPEESKTFLEEKGFTKDKLDREIKREMVKADPLGKEYLDYLVIMRNDYDEIVECK